MSTTRKNDGGFSLVELLTVIGVMAVLVGLTIPAISGARSTYNRKSAVDTVMTTIEQARVAALQNGENVYVMLALATDSGVSPDAMMVVGDPPIGSTATSEIYYTHWIKLPPNVRFLTASGTIATSLANNFPPSTVTAFPVSQTTLPSIGGSPVSSYLITYLYFNSTGAVQYPTTGLELALFEGTRSVSGIHYSQKAVGPSAAATKSLSATGLYEVIRLSQYSGRSWMDVSGL
jgi:prepilin-type N-terminal cleavage/methylation domain-containing protein